MQTSHSPSINHDRVARAAILNGSPIPAVTEAILRSRGVDVGALEQRVLASVEFKR